MSDTPTIRLESGYGPEVIWFPGPTRHSDVGLSAALVADLDWWRRRIEGKTDHVDHNGPFPSPVNPLEAGRRLAKQLSDEVGEGFKIELWYDGLRDTFEADHPAWEPIAAAFFTARVDDL